MDLSPERVDQIIAQAERYEDAAEYQKAYELLSDLQRRGQRPDYCRAAIQRLRLMHYLLHVSSAVGAKGVISISLAQQQGIDHWQRVLADPALGDPRRLERHGRKNWSQNDEDGIIEEIFRRIGESSRTFMEIGVEDGLENNSLLLLHKGWRGMWVEASQRHGASIRANFPEWLQSGQLVLKNQFATTDNINELLAELPADLDLLSVDVDGSDYYLLEAIGAARPRVIVVEYNGKFPPGVRAVVPSKKFAWQGNDYFGSSLSSLTALLEGKGYRLVGCNITGANAFFVRADVAGDHFAEPATPEHLYQPPRYYMSFTTFRKVGHEPGPGSYLPL
jgi:hypothetical protein